MPIRKKNYNKKKTYRRKKTYKRKGFRPTSNYAMSTRAPLGKTFKFMSRYIDMDLGLDPSSGGVPATHVFSMNGLYDPDISLTGHQSLAFDNMMLFYNHYTVIGSKARMTFQNTDTSYCQTIHCQLKDTSSTTVNTVGALENGLCKYLTLGPHGSGNAIKVMTIPCSPNKFFGKKVLQDDIYRGDASNNPTEQVYLHITCTPPSGVDTSKVRFTIELDFISILSEPKQLAQS